MLCVIFTISIVHVFLIVFIYISLQILLFLPYFNPWLLMHIKLAYPGEYMAQ